MDLYATMLLPTCLPEVIFTLGKIGKSKVGVHVDKKHTLNVIRIKLNTPDKYKKMSNIFLQGYVDYQ